MPRVRIPDKKDIHDPAILRAIDSQEQTYGAMLPNSAVLARLPAIFRGFRAMWDGLEASARLDARLASLVNVQVAGLIGCSL